MSHGLAEGCRHQWHLRQVSCNRLPLSPNN